MYTDFMLNNCVRIFKLMNLLWVSPLRIDNVRGKLYIHLASRCRVTFIWTWWVAYVIIVLPTHLYTLHSNSELTKFNFTIIIHVGCWGASIIIGVFCVKAEELCQVFNAILKYFPDFKDKYMKSYDFKKDKMYYLLLEFLTVAAFWFCFALAFFIALDSYVRPTAAPYVLFSIEPRLITWPIYLIGATWQAFFAVGVGSVIGFIGYSGILFMGLLLPLIKKELRPGLKSYKTCASLRSDPFNLVTTWRSIEILIKYINLAVGFALLYCQFCMTTIILFSVVTSVYQWNISGLLIKSFMVFAGCFCFIAWTIFLSLAGIQYKWSEDTIKSWNYNHWHNKKDFAYMQRIILCCTPFSIGDGHRFFVRPITVLKFFNSVSRNTFRALITYADIVNFNRFV